LISSLSQYCPEVIKTLSSELFEMAEKEEDFSSARFILKALIDANFDFINQNGDRFIQCFVQHKTGSKFLVEEGIEKDESFARNHGAKILELVQISKDHLLFETFLKKVPDAFHNEKAKLIEMEEGSREEFISLFIQKEPAFGVKYKKDILDIALNLSDASKKVEILRGLILCDKGVLETDQIQILEVVRTFQGDREKSEALMESIDAGPEVLKKGEGDLLNILATFAERSKAQEIFSHWMKKDPEMIKQYPKKLLK